MLYGSHVVGEYGTNAFMDLAHVLSRFDQCCVCSECGIFLEHTKLTSAQCSINLCNLMAYSGVAERLSAMSSE